MILHGGLFVLFYFCGLHRYIDPGGDTGGPGILLAQPAELLAHMVRALTVEEGDVPLEDKLANVVDYGAVVDGIKDILAGGHLNLVETLADRIADFCLSDRRVRVARVRIEKLKVVAEAKSVGVEIERESPH